MCIVCGNGSTAPVCKDCISSRVLEKVCADLMRGKSDNIHLADFIANAGGRRNCFSKVLEICDIYTGYDLVFFKVKAYSKLNHSYDEQIIRCGLQYEKTHTDRNRIISILREVARAYLNEYEFYKAIEVCNRLTEVYKDAFAPYYKAECLLKIWLVDDAICELEKCLAVLRNMRSRGLCDKAVLDKHIVMLIKRIDEYNYKKSCGYKYSPEKEEGRAKLLKILEDEGRNAERKMYMYDTSLNIKSFVALDFETTGVRHNDRVTEIGAVKVIDGEIKDEYSRLVNPGIPIPEMITELTGISNDMVADEPCMDEVFDELMEFWDGLPLVAHNAAFDMRFLTRETDKHNIRIDVPIVDTLSLARKVWPGLERYKLTYLTEHFNIAQSHAHRAICDAEATAKLYLLMQKK